jgi:hypothetical protein
MLLLSTILVSEPLFAAVLLSMLAGAERMVATDHPRSKYFAFGLACGALALIRTHGLSLPAAVILLLAVRGQWKHAAVCGAGVVVAIAPWQLWQSLHAAQLPGALQGSYGSYVGWFVEGMKHDGFLGRTLATNAREVWSLIGGRFALSDAPFMIGLGAAAAAIVMSFGAWRMYRRAPATVVFAVIYAIIVMFWPYTPWRFVFGIWPIVILFIGEAARYGVQEASDRATAGILVATATGVVCAGMVVREARSIRERGWSVPSRVATQQTLPSMFWILRNTKETEVVASEAEELVYLYTGRKSVPVMPFEAREYGVPRSAALDGAGVRRVVETLPVNYVASISRDLRLAAGQIDFGSASSIRLVLLDTLSGGGVFRVIR